MSESKKNESSFLLKACAFIVDKRNLFFLLFAIAVIFSVFSRNWVKVENSLSAFLPGHSETRIGLDIMETEFTTFGTADIMIANVSYAQAEDILLQIQQTEGVDAVAFDNTADHFNNAGALYSLTFCYDETDDRCLDTIARLQEKLSGYDMYLSTGLGDQSSEIIAAEMQGIIVIVAIVVLSVLIFTSQSFAEVPVLIITFLVSAIINMGTNFWLDTISFVSNSVTIVLQLALSLDYAIIFCNRYKEERLTHPAREATIFALSKAIPEIFSSSLTTVGGLAALLFMQFKIGPDLGIVLIKAIFFSLLSVFVLMPGLLMLFSGKMEKTKHKNFVPRISFVGRFAYKTKYIVPPVFLAILVAAFIFSNKCPYVYGYSMLTTPKLNSTTLAKQMIETNFSSTNMVALIVPAGNPDGEKALLKDLEERSEVDYAMGLANIEAMDGYTLTDKLTPRQFSELTDMDYDQAQLIYAAYAVNDADYAKVVNGLSGYKVPLMDMFLYLYDRVQDGYVTLDSDMQESLDDAHKQMSDAKAQLQGENYSRMLVFLTLPQESAETFAFLEEIHTMAAKYYTQPVYLAGESVSQNDLRKSFETDNLVISVVSVLVVLGVLLFTFKSVGMPLLLILVIQGVIWINFSQPYLTGSNLFFMSYLIVSSIQMGANIDYAIVISSRYQELKNKMSQKDAIIDTMNFAFPTILTSGAVLAIAGILIGRMTSEAAIVGIGECLGRGTILSIIIVMFVLPQMLLLGDKIIERTSFSVSLPIQAQRTSGLVRLDGHVRGTINGAVNGIVHATVKGDVNVHLLAGSPQEIQEDEKND
ncbi:MAG: MMPL family transporter [Oscillospiraceae bacterium]|nr:MMPL family transporter [Oscillospiraceae bacterium]